MFLIISSVDLGHSFMENSIRNYFVVNKLVRCVGLIGCSLGLMLQLNYASAKDLPPELQFTCELALKHAPETDPKKERTKKCELWSAKHKVDSAIAATSAAATQIETPLTLCMQEIKKGDAAGAQNRFENCLSQAILESVLCASGIAFLNLLHA